MVATAAQIAANRRNSGRSTGPRTAEGKARSRANSLQHGLTGEGVVLAAEDAAAVADRAALLEAELRPSGEMGRILVRRVALLSHRMERCGAQELAATAIRVRSACSDFDEARAAAIEALMDRLEDEPATAVRQLSRTPAGVDRLIGAWLDLLEDLDHPGDVVWDSSHWKRAEALGGRTAEAFPLSSLTRWHLAYEGKPSLLLNGEAEGLRPEEVRDWARGQIAGQIAREVERLREVRGTLDEETIELDRAEAPARALFDPSAPACLARKYEAAAERGMYRALRELDEIEAGAGAEAAGPAQATARPPESEGARGTLASFFPTTLARPEATGAASDRGRPAPPSGEGRATITAGGTSATPAGSSSGR